MRLRRVVDVTMIVVVRVVVRVRVVMRVVVRLRMSMRVRVVMRVRMRVRVRVIVPVRTGPAVAVVVGRSVGGAAVEQDLDARRRRPVPFDGGRPEREAGKSQRTQGGLEFGDIDPQADEGAEQHVAAHSADLFEVKVAHQRTLRAAAPRAISPAAWPAP
jgi:hypothetical protein